VTVDTRDAAHAVVIADDEPLARERLRQLLARHAGWTIAAECRTGPQAVDAILEYRPSVVFLDIRMPGLDGLEVADAIAGDEGEPGPAIVFVTAYDEFALRAFDVSAADYLLSRSTAVGSTGRSRGWRRGCAPGSRSPERMRSERCSAICAPISHRCAGSWCVRHAATTSWTWATWSGWRRRGTTPRCTPADVCIWYVTR